MINRERLVNTFFELVSIDSPSGEEGAVFQELDRRLTELGFHVQQDSYGNLIASEKGDDPLILSAHLDTVEPGRGINPRVEGDYIVSDGTTILGGDCKAGITAILEAIESIKEDGKERIPIQLAFTREEERGLLGAKNLDFTLLNGAQAVVFDGEGPANHITSGSPTYLRFDVQIKGRGAHAGVEPEKGLSAIRIAAEIISKFPQGRLDDETTFNVGIINGGSVRNAVPEVASFSGEARSFDQSKLDGVKDTIVAILSEAKQLYPDAIIEEAIGYEFQTYTISVEEAVAVRVITALSSIGLDPFLGPSGGGTDGNVFRAHGVQAVVVGMGTNAAHTVREHVEISQLIDVARFCQALLAR